MRTANFKGIPIIQLTVSLLTSFGFLQHVNVRNERVFSQGVTIRLNKNSPAVAAFEDAQNNYNSKFDEAKSETKLEANETSVVFKPEPKVRTLAVTAIKISTPDEKNIRELEFPSLLGRDGELLTLNERKTQIRDFLIESNIDLRNKSWQEEARRLTMQAEQEEAAEAKTKVTEKTAVADVLRGEEVVARVIGPSALATSSGAPLKPEASEESEMQPETEAAEELVIARFDQPVKRNEPAANGFSFLSNPVKQEFPYDIEGDILLMNGLAFNGNNLRVFWENDGQERVMANIDYSKGSYFVRVDKLEGYLVAELLDDNGELIGLSEVDLFQFPALPYQNSKIQKLDLEVKPLESGLAVQILSARSFGIHKIVPENLDVQIDELNRKVMIQEKGTFKDQEIEKNSSLVLRAQAPDHWATNATLVANGPLEIKMFPEKMVDALLKYTQQENARNRGIIWGQVKFGGKELSGVEVDLAEVEGNSNPIYFKKMSDFIDLPARELKATDKNGLFAFVGLTAGVHAVRAKIDGVYYPAQLVNVESDTVSYVDLNFSGMRSVNINVTDPINNISHLSGTLSVFGAELEIDVTGQGDESIQCPVSTHSTMVEVDAGSAYEKSRVFIEKDARVFSAITVPKDWLHKIADTANVELADRKNMIVGFVERDDFDVLVSQKNRQQQKIVYFDAKGDVLEKQEGVAGGGFVIFYSDEVLQTVAVLPVNSKKVATRIVYPETDFVSVLKF